MAIGKMEVVATCLGFVLGGAGCDKKPVGCDSVPAADHRKPVTSD